MLHTIGDTPIVKSPSEKSTTQSTEIVPQDLIKFPHAVEVQEVIQALKIDLSIGVNTSEVEARQKQYGINSLQAIHQRPAWKIFISQFASLIIALLGFAACVAWATGDHLDAMAIGVVLFLNALIGFATEWQAGRALDALRKQVHTLARVRRDGHEKNLEAEELAVGDVVILNAGDLVPADVRILESTNLRTEESALTGESTTVEKDTAAVASNAPLAERKSMLYLGTTVVAGRAIGLVTQVGIATELGRIGRLVATAQEEPTPLERRLGELGKNLVHFVLGVAVIVMVAGWIRGDDLWLMVEVGISLAVAAVPEALPAVTTLILALGVLRMAKRRALVRKLSAVETLGSTTIICTDKTGTLTENRMTVREYYLTDGTVINCEGNHGKISPGSDLLYRSLRAGVLCNEAFFRASPEGETHSIGDPTETALLSAAHQFGMDVEMIRTLYPKIDEVPFDPVTKRMITVHKSNNGEQLVILKGAPAIVLDSCSKCAAGSDRTISLDEPLRKKLISTNQEMADQAMRVLALAEKSVLPAQLTQPGRDSLQEGYVFLGFVGMIDPPREGVAEAIEHAHRAGIRVVMLTGDQINTAQAIARELRLSGDKEPIALHAHDLENADSAQIAELARKADVFARVSPEDKLRIVESLMKTGEVVAVTGDGVNDAPALKRADIGVAMGLRGTEVAKEASDLVLADDNFTTILHAVEDGRVIYTNIIKFVHLMFSKNLAEILVIFFSILFGWALPLLPLQILWLNLVTDVFPAMALAVEPAEPGIMNRPPRSPKEAFLSRSFLFTIGWQGIMLTLITLWAYGWALNQYGAGAHARTIALFVIVGSQLGHLFNCRSQTLSVMNGIFRNPFIWFAVLIVTWLQFLAIEFYPLARVLGTEFLNLSDIKVILLTTFLPVLIVEVTKLVKRQRKTVES